MFLILRKLRRDTAFWVWVDLWTEELLSQSEHAANFWVRSLSITEIARRSSTRRATRAQEDIARKQVSNTAAGRDSAVRAAGVGRERVQS